ncbi:hypothetical protein C8A00DRAFT_45036 [Chaetomidium leptoderma]|uniref:DNA (cytosine-5)-methyltransferase 1 replication foci domain-containing protein n=1 Tax=Chaetomidium leptoderma TaxID=669021 RepID=A0AAN6VIP0_9PEZI|nr:hypothetical protein C8A00DRAFT_45036 [Chaetomidium leptoderma]
MAGRPRRAGASSTPTAATVDQSNNRWAKESSVLKPAPHDLLDHAWHCYVLTDATIYRKDGKTLANPLLVNIQGPLVVRGYLEVDDDKGIDNLVRPSVKSAYIEIAHSDRYSIGEGPLGVVLWVSGAAGWFEIQPSVKYQPMYDQIREAITLYYSAFEVYEAYNLAHGKKKKARRPSPPAIEQSFLKYAVRVGDGILRDEVEALYHKWAEFFIAHFEKEVDLDWNTTPFAKWLRNSHPDVQKKLADIASGVIPPPPPVETPDPDETRATQNRSSRSARASSRNSESVDMRNSGPDRSRSPQPKPPNRASAKTTETPIPLPEKYRQQTRPASSKPFLAPVGAPKDAPRDAPMPDADPESPVDRLLVFLQEIVAEKPTITKAAPSTIHAKVYFKCKIRQVSARHYSSGAKDILAYYAKELLPRLDLIWKGTPLYEWLEDAAKTPWKPTEPEPLKPEDIPAQTLRRTKLGPKPGASTKPATQLPPTINLKAKMKRAVQNESDSDSEEDVAGPYVTPQMRSRRAGKGAGLRLISTSKKRPYSDLDDQANGSRRGRKSAKVSHQISDEDEHAVEPEDTSDDEVAAGPETAVGSRLPLPEGAVRVVVHAERIPTTSPKGPDGTWTCDQEGCAHVVRSADEQDAQELIQEHFRDHEAQAEKINLAVKESRGHMPIKYAYFPPILLLVHMPPHPGGT